MTLTLGRIVHYALSQLDADNINHRRARHRALWMEEHIKPEDRILATQGNQVTVGDVFPAVVVRVNDDHNANLQVYLDGEDCFWATSRVGCGELQGALAGQWFWPPRV